MERYIVSRLGTCARLVTFFVFFSIIFFKFGPISFHPIEMGLDQSWQAALAYAAGNKLNFGADIAFTGGPLSSIFTRQFSETNIYLISLASIAIVIWISIYLTTILFSNFSRISAALFIVSISLCLVSKDTVLFVVPFLAGLVGVQGRTRTSYAMGLAGSFLAGLIVLAKFSVFPLSLLSAVILDVRSIVSKRPPVHVVAVLGSIAVGFAVTGQELSSILPFLTTSLEVSRAYSAAMSVSGYQWEIWVWLACASVLFCVLVCVSIASYRKTGSFDNFLHLCLISGFLFIGWKAGFVRHDLHSLIAWSCLAIAAGCASFVFSASAIPRYLCLLVALGATLPGHVLLAEIRCVAPFCRGSGIVKQLYNQAEELKTYVVQPAKWYANQFSRNEAALASIARGSLLPHLDGTVDVIPSEQSEVIALGLDYTPRPTIQEYTTYSRELIRRNAEFFAGDHAPDYLIMAPGSIDGRHPASAEGSQWPLFFSRYEPDSQIHERVILKKRKVALENLLRPVGQSVHAFDERIELPKTYSPLMIRIEMEQTVPGRIANFVFRAPLTFLVVDYDDGSSQTYRLIPEMAAAGFLISPLVHDASTYVLVSSGHSDYRPLKHAVSVSVTRDASFLPGYKNKLRVSFDEMDNKILADNTHGQLVQSAVERSNSVLRLLESNQLQEPLVGVVSEGLQAHAPATLRLPVSAAHKIRLSYGLRQGSWTSTGGTDGACFVVRANQEILLNHCLTPQTVPADRKEQSSLLTIPPGVDELSLETQCLHICAWDWTYWGVIRDE